MPANDKPDAAYELAGAPSPERQRLIAWCRTRAISDRDTADFVRRESESDDHSAHLYEADADIFDAIAEALEAQGAARPPKETK